MIVLAIDCGFVTGYGVIGHDGCPLATGSHSVDGSSAEMGVALRSFAKIINDIITRFEPNAVVTATPFIGMKVRPVQLRPIMAFPARLQEICLDREIFYKEYLEHVARRYFLRPSKIPKGTKNIKSAIRQGCFDRGWPIKDSHSCDALCIADYAHNRLSVDRCLHVARLPLFTSKKGSVNP